MSRCERVPVELVAAGPLPPLPMCACKTHFMGRIQLDNPAVLDNQGD